ncbi:MAG TPA: DNA repair protein RecO [Clostridiales bacterium]|nr:MAG: DNA repair protein RecO [Firmicutes bacterium ADurb.Bin262]HOU09442.1 DNA repair protein RecO [Clostridiales bacterium]HQH62154.1 DNA repair protein RecO [Clostridiales bacterium]
MVMNTDGLVIKTSDTGESDRIITVLTRDFGVVRAFANGAKRPKSRLGNATQALSYADFTFYAGRDSHTVGDARAKRVFFGLGSDMRKTALAQYFCELALELAPENDEASQYLKLLLNALDFLDTGKRPPALIKAVTEMRLACLAGYAPELTACAACGREDGAFALDAAGGRLLCPACGGADPLPAGVLAALRHICCAEASRIFFFTLPDNALNALSAVSENYLKAHLQRRFKSLEFYYAIQ